MPQADSDWDNVNNHLVKTFYFDSFNEAFNFSDKIRHIANRLNHHPDLLISWGKLVVMTTTHDTGEVVTHKDEQLSEAIDQL